MGKKIRNVKPNPEISVDTRKEGIQIKIGELPLFVLGGKEGVNYTLNKTAPEDIPNPHFVYGAAQLHKFAIQITRYPKPFDYLHQHFDYNALLALRNSSYIGLEINGRIALLTESKFHRLTGKEFETPVIYLDELIPTGPSTRKYGTKYELANTLHIVCKANEFTFPRYNTYANLYNSHGMEIYLGLDIRPLKEAFELAAYEPRSFIDNKPSYNKYELPEELYNKYLVGKKKIIDSDDENPNMA